MSRTLDDIFDDVRDILQDSVTPYRYSEESLVRAMNNALSQTYRVRPDAFFGTYDSDLPSYTTADLGIGTVFPIHEMFATPVIYFMAGFAELRDDEFNVDARAATLLKQFAAELRGAM